MSDTTLNFVVVASNETISEYAQTSWGGDFVTFFNVDTDQGYTRLKSRFIKLLNRELATLPHPWIRNVRLCEISVIPLLR